MGDKFTISAVIFDLDGLLIDTEAMAHRAHCFALEQLDIPVDDAFFLSLIGRTSNDTDGILEDSFGPEFVLADYKLHSRAHFEREIGESGIPAKAGAKDLLSWLASRSIPFSLATSSTTDRAHFKLDAAGLGGYFEAVIGGDQVSRGKPAPDIIHRAALALDKNAKQCMVLEDSLNGVRAAHAAGALPVVVPDMIAPEAEISAKAHRILDSLHDAAALIDELFE